MAPYRRLVRRTPLLERIQARLNPYDFLLWLSEELESGDWDQWARDWGWLVGCVLNLVMLIACANVGRGSKGDDVFLDDSDTVGAGAWLATFLVHFLSLLSCGNTAYTFYRKRHYRLFEASVDNIPSTPSAKRVRVDSSPVASSPLKYLSSMLSGDPPEDRAHPDPKRHVLELAVWDPMPLSLNVFCSFSPGHVAIYWLFLPLRPSDPRPSVTVATTLLLAGLLSLQLSLLRHAFVQQSKDSAYIHKEVLNEYDIKFVHPRTQHNMRDVGTQFPIAPARSLSGRGDQERAEVDTHQPFTAISTSFQTHPNQNYLMHIDPDAHRHQETPQPRSRPERTATPSSRRPSQVAAVSKHDLTSPLQHRNEIRRTQASRVHSGPAVSDGGSLGVYSHAHSPLKKSGSAYFASNPRYSHLTNMPRRESGRS